MNLEKLAKHKPTMPRYQSMINAQMQVQTGDTSLQGRTIKDSQTRHEVIRDRVIAKIKEVELTGGPKILNHKAQ